MSQFGNGLLVTFLLAFLGLSSNIMFVDAFNFESEGIASDGDDFDFEVNILGQSSAEQGQESSSELDSYELLLRQSTGNETTTPASNSTTPASNSTTPASNSTTPAANSTTPIPGGNSTTPTTPTNVTTPSPIPISQITQQAVGTDLLLSPGNIVLITGSGSGNFRKGKAFFEYKTLIVGNQCVLSVGCPCIKIPPSWNCAKSFLKLTTDFFYNNQKFCGGTIPGQSITAVSDELKIAFKPHPTLPSSFACIVSCTAAGMNLTATTGTVSC